MLDLRRFLRINDLKQSEVAQYLGVNQSRISHYIKQGTLPLEKLEKLLNNQNGWDTSMIRLSDLDTVEQEDSSDSRVISIYEFAKFTRDVISDYQERLSEKDEIIKELVKSVMTQNGILNNTVEKLMAANNLLH